MEPSEAVEVRLLGRPAVHHGGAWEELVPSKPSALLLYLAFHDGWVGRDELVHLFWPDAPEGRARGNLRPLLRRAMVAPYAGGVERERSRVRWTVRTDVQRFREAVERRRWREAWQYVRGEVLAGFTIPAAPEFESWLESERAELRGVARAAGRRAADELLAAGDGLAAIEVLATLHRDDPLDEAVARPYLAALAGAGDRPAALAAFERLRRTLADEVGVEPEEETVRLVEALRRGEIGTRVQVAAGHGQQPSAPRTVASTMPIQPTRLVGRVREREALAAELADPSCRLLTVVGPGGVGKTRLAIAVASAVTSRFQHGALFVDLATVDTDEAQASAIVRSLGQVGAEGSDSARRFLEYVRDRELLLLLDNLEHLVGRLGIVADALASSPRLKVLATSRARLGLLGERVFDLAGLSFSGAGREHEPSDAVTLFLRAARRVRPELRDGPEPMAVIGRICRALGGLPLAIELAARWSRVLTLHEIDAELSGGPDLLDVTSGDAPARQAGMRAVFDHSWSLLGERERRAARGLAVFRGGWSREAAWAVADVGLPTLLALVDASLVRREPSGRFTWHSLVGDYAAARAAEHPSDRDTVEARHARYFLELVAERQYAWRGLEGGRLLGELDGEVANVVAAWRWAVAHRDSELLAAAFAGLCGLCWTGNRLKLLRELSEEALEIAASGSVLRGRAMFGIGAAAVSHLDRGVLEVSSSRLGDALALFEALGSVPDVADTLGLIAAEHKYQGRWDQARAALRRASELHRSLGATARVAEVEAARADTAASLDEALARYATVLAAGRRAGEAHAESMASVGLGVTLFRAFGHSAMAREAIARGIELNLATGFRQFAQRVRLVLAEVLAASGAIHEAEGVVRTTMREAADLPFDETAHNLAIAHALLGWILYLRADADAANASCRDVFALMPGEPPTQAQALALAVAARTALDRGDLEEASSHVERGRELRERSLQARPYGASWYARASPLPLAYAWVRLLASESDLELARGEAQRAGQVVAESLSIGMTSLQVPSTLVALGAAARVFAARGDATAVCALADLVRRHPSTPFDALQAVERLDTCRQGSERAPADSVPWLSGDDVGSDPGLGRVVAAVTSRL
jgi:predicted ATPase/DNA-binding SARP family transcriptional activator